MKFWFCVWLLLVPTAAWAQQEPVEIDLVAPAGYRVQEVSPTWTVPERPCLLCRSLGANAICRCDEPLTQASAQSLLSTAKAALAATTGGQLKFLSPVTVEAVTHQRLMQLGGEPLWGLYQDGVIFVSLDLNRRRALGVIAHELGHAWHFQNRPDIEAPSELLFEGFAEFVSFLVLQHFDKQESISQMQQRDQTVYGRGARILIAKYHREGLNSVLQEALTGL